jgi:hypothetical protein
MRERLPFYIARIRLPLLWIFLGIVVANLFTDLPWAWTAWILLVVALACYFVVGTVRREPIDVASPVTGRWIAVNTPADRVPSHALHAYGQTYAIDLVHHPDEDVDWTAVRRWPPARRPETFPGFGQPVYAAADGVVVRRVDWLRDHWSRDSWLGLLYLLVEMGPRELLGGPRFILGNHVVIDMGGGVYAAYAHLRRGSVQVEKGRRVTAGEQIAECGNSGNSSEPHLHFQLMDHRNVLFAAGLPFTFTRYEADGSMVRSDVPAGRRAFTVEIPGKDEFAGRAKR